MKSKIDIYDGKPPGDFPLYSITDAAHYLQLPATTVRSWAIGRDYKTVEGKTSFHPVISIADLEKRLLSFSNLVELHVLSSIRYEHKVKLNSVRDAIDYLRTRLDSDRPLLESEMLTDGKDIFVERVGQLINASRNGQNEMKAVVDSYLKRISRNDLGIPIKLFPFTRQRLDQLDQSPCLVSIDPKIRFGKPCIAGTSIPTAIIAERHKAGESFAFLADDYRREINEIEEAIRYESRVAS